MSAQTGMERTRRVLPSGKARGQMEPYKSIVHDIVTAVLVQQVTLHPCANTTKPLFRWERLMSCIYAMLCNQLCLFETKHIYFGSPFSKPTCRRPYLDFSDDQYSQQAWTSSWETKTEGTLRDEETRGRSAG